jgi:2'-5' RNA ligase
VAGDRDTLRLFLAVPCPAPLVDRLQQVQFELAAEAWDLDVCRPEDFHLTLHFLGATPERVLDDLKKELGALCHARRPFDVSCGGLGCFPDELQPRVLWAGIRDPAGKLEELYGAARRVLNGYRLFKLRDEFTPHLSLARVTRLSRAWDPALLRGLAPQWRDLGDFPVDRVALMASGPAGDGPRHRVLDQFVLCA